MLAAIDLKKVYHSRQGPHPVLKGVNFSIGTGERMAVLGRNGAGKSTLMRILAGVERPTSGRVERKMSLSWPIGLAGGFQGSLTGYDNIRFISRVYNKDIEEVNDFVTSFSELGKFLREPVKTYSSGMRARLAFGLSLAIEFDCYLVDEVIFVGDQRFHRKCQEELFERDKNRSLILISHDGHILRQYCSSALVLHSGMAKVFYDLDVALDIYNAL
ncbi:ABC transporter ATP-binding protein [Rhizobium deserti]|uniref:ABC transporter ATP-binding protein n=1 Tax=Rhizobium deserti TaxID=2547961 RepID=A0A4V3APE3_9HYPH|nr:ABC transporter ATP-binding protein [Rhizobium deserti]TDK36605.1 ABC transporter ATP-binding protein [Rhizobium deserti]